MTDESKSNVIGWNLDIKKSEEKRQESKREEEKNYMNNKRVEKTKEDNENVPDKKEYSHNEVRGLTRSELGKILLFCR